MTDPAPLQEGSADWEALRAEFPVSNSNIFLNHAGVGPTSLRSANAVSRFMSAYAHLGRTTFESWEDQAEECRRKYAALIGAEPEEIAFIRNTSHGLGLAAYGIDWRPGDRVAVAADLEYPSNVYPWQDLARRGLVSVDVIEPVEGAVVAEAVERALRPETRLVAASTAQYATGGVTELEELGRLCRDKGVLLCADGIQTVGALPTDVRKTGVHVLSADSHKWMLGMMGIGAVFVDREMIGDLHPPLIGWRSTSDAFNFDRVHLELADTARRFEEGSLAYPLIAGFSATVDILREAGVDRIARRIGGLVNHLVDRLTELGCDVGPSASRRRHIVTFTHPHVDPETIHEALKARNVVASVRRGAVRLSPHFYNTIGELEVVVDAVASVMKTPSTR